MTWGSCLPMFLPTVNLQVESWKPKQIFFFFFSVSNTDIYKFALINFHITGKMLKVDILNKPWLHYTRSKSYHCSIPSTDLHMSYFFQIEYYIFLFFCTLLSFFPTFAKGTEYDHLFDSCAASMFILSCGYWSPNLVNQQNRMRFFFTF